LQLISKALERVKRERPGELKALREARQAQQAKHAAKQDLKPGEKAHQERSAACARPTQHDKSKQQSCKREHEHECKHKLPPGKGPEAPQMASKQAAPAKTEPSGKAEGLPDTAAAAAAPAVESQKQQRVLSADGLPKAARFEAAAQLTALAAAADQDAHRAGPAVEDSKDKPTGKSTKAGSGQKRNRQLVSHSSDDKAAPGASRPHAEPAAAEKGALQQQQATPAKAIHRLKSTTPAPSSRAQDEDGAVPNADDSVEKEQRKMREALEKVLLQFPWTNCHDVIIVVCVVHCVGVWMGSLT
jgi:hypothetical protein